MMSRNSATVDTFGSASHDRLICSRIAAGSNRSISRSTSAASASLDAAPLEITYWPAVPRSSACASDTIAPNECPYRENSSSSSARASRSTSCANTWIVSDCGSTRSDPPWPRMST